MRITAPVELEFKPERQAKILKPFTMPAAKGEKKNYVIRLKKECPFEYITIAGESITKYKHNADYSLVKNSGKNPDVLIPSFSLADNQMKAFLERVNEMDRTFFDKEKRQWEVGDVKDWVEITEVKDFLTKSLVETEEVTP